ncbi:ABC transporter ATP-binding protein [Syntrophomonas palmitatica]|uniref:ABC transporter ATP-binding protein n=1 Tax=Syntrophomonas palmitatica TaxID=402877 RepID=UPI0006D0F8C5|nr:sn-glycerol-3-phosphate ABC transporter ATP-binding protein UgpC [Syntrophomonas palmitatica]
MAGIVLDGVNKIYPNGFHAVKDADFTCADHEFVILLGPSGCGKTSILRMIAGLEEISSGQVYIGERLVNEVEARDRDVAMVFQNYALYPHMTVFDNLAFALKLRKMSKPDIKMRVHEAARMLDIEGLLPLRPRQLSGGQMQRVALGRAMVRQPQVFLLDEPLSNLDMQLRVQMRSELIRMHKQLGTTFIYVTHDQMEAMTMGSIIVVMKDGVLQQAGSPLDVYDKPVNMFVAGFVGSPAMNFLQGCLGVNGGQVSIKGTGFCFQIPEHKITASLKAHTGKPVIIGIRPEDIWCTDVYGEESGPASPVVQVDIIEQVGYEYYLHLDLEKQRLVARTSRSLSARPGDRIRISLDLKRLHLFDYDSQEALI